MLKMILLLIAGITLCSLISVNGIEISETTIGPGTLECPVEGQEYQYCQTCPATCSNPDLSCTKGSCTFGCGCPNGQLIDTVRNKCVNPAHCPLNCNTVECTYPSCVHGATLVVPQGQCCSVCGCTVGSTVYLPGQSFQQNCNICTCSNKGKIICTTNVCGFPHH